jgi:hypothetical protein
MKVLALTKKDKKTLYKVQKPSFSYCLTHFISKYVVNKKRKSADPSQTFISVTIYSIYLEKH